MKTVFWKQLYASFEAFLDADGSRPDEGRLEKIFYILAAGWLVLWTLLPSLCVGNAFIDVSENVAWGQHFQFGYDKNPYFGAWLTYWSYRLIPSAAVALLIAGLMILFLKTRLGLSIRATGDNPDMVRASSINTAFTVTVGLCIANALTALSGALLAQYQKSADINLGTGMVIIGLASLIIGEALLPKGKLWLKVLGAILGSVVYRFIIAMALRIDLPTECLKLVSAVIVALAIGLPALRSAKGGKVKC